MSMKKRLDMEGHFCFVAFVFVSGFLSLGFSGFWFLWFIKCAANVFYGFCVVSAFVVFVPFVVLMVCGSCGSWFLRPLGLFWFVCFCGFLAFVFLPVWVRN